MRIPLLALLLSAATAVGSAADLPADPASFHIFLLMGQSNMAGSALPVLEDYREPSSRVLAQSSDLTWQASRAAVAMSPGHSFARLYAALHPGVTVGLIQCARGGRSLGELSKGGQDRDGAPNYDNALKRARAAARQGALKGVLWHQGESDAGDAGYVARLAATVADLRSDLTAPELPFICGELGRFAGWTAAFNGRIGTAAREIPRCAVASSEALLDLGDRVHFSGFSAEVLGARYLAQYLQLAEPALAPRFQNELATITARMLAREAAWTVLLNGDMTEGCARPFAWDLQWTGKGALAVVRDPATAVSAPASLRLDSAGGPVLGSLAQPLRGVAGKTITVGVQIRNAGFTSCQVVITGIDGNWKQVLNQPIITATAGVWTQLSGRLAIPAGVPNIRLALVVDGEGQAWFDDVTVALSDTPPAPAGTNLLTNPGMEAGETAPTGWSSTWAGTGKVASRRDTQVFRTGPAALRVEAVGGAAKGNASQALDGVAGRQVRVTGWVRTEAGTSAQVGLGAFDADWKMLAWETIHVAPGGQDWTAFERTVAVPAGAVHVNLATGIDGAGKAWFDDLSASAP
jgi:hypothetical protein